jgi:hypothetical protein
MMDVFTSSVQSWDHMDPNIQKPIAHRGFAVREMILSVAARGSARALGRILAKYVTYYNQIRTHVSLGRDAPCTRPIERFGSRIRSLAGSTIDTLESSFQKRQDTACTPVCTEN